MSVKFMIEVELDGYDSPEEADSALDEGLIHECLEDYAISVVQVQKLSD